MPVPAPIRRAALIGSAVALVVFAALVSGGHPSGLLERGPFSSDFFDAQAEALLDGHLDVDPNVAGLEGFERPDGTHLYFGLVPSLLRLPIAAVSDGFDGRLTQVSMLLALAVALAASTRLVWRGRCWHRGVDEVPLRSWEPAVCGAFVATVGLASPLLFLGARTVVYHEVELWGTALALVALDAILGWWEAPTTRGLVGASLWVAVAFNTRASVGGGALAALALVLGLALLWGHQPWRRLPMLGLAVVAPLLTYAAVNVARFDSAFSVPFEDQVLSGFDANRQAALEATDGSLFGAEYAPSALATYLRPDGVTVQRLFPWITFREERPTIGDPVFDTVDRSASLPVVAPTLLVQAAVGATALVRRRRRDAWLAAAIGTAAGVVPTITIGFIAHRYLADFTPLLVLLAAVGTWSTADALAAVGAARRRAATGALAALAVAGMAVSLALAVQAQRLLLLPDPDERAGFVQLQYRLDDAMRGGAPPSVARVEAITGPGRRGEVAVLGACDGVYWSDGSLWFPVELGGDRRWVLDGALPDGQTVLVHARDWAVVADVRDGVARVRYDHDDPARDREGPALVLDGGAVHRVDVRLDLVGTEVVVRIDGHHALTGWLVDLSGLVEAGEGWARERTTTPFCDDLTARLDASGDQPQRSTRPRAGSSS